MMYKTILKGRLDFGKRRTYDKVIDLFAQRFESYYKSDILLELEEIFDEENIRINIPRKVDNAMVKSWRNTVAILEYAAEFAVAGNITAWVMENGKPKHQAFIEPKSDRQSVQQFLKARDLIETAPEEALEAFDFAIMKHPNHWSAYCGKGQVYHNMENYEHALRDYSKAIELYHGDADAYFGRAKIKIFLKDYEGAIPDLIQSYKNTIPVQPIYWQARYLMGRCQYELKNWEAVLDLKYFCKRDFDETNLNSKFKQAAHFMYGKALLKTESFADAWKQFDLVIKSPEGKEAIKEVDMFTYRGIAQRKAGKTGYKKDIERGKKSNLNRATELISHYLN